MDSEEVFGVDLENGNGGSDTSTPMEGLVLNLDKENEKIDNGIIDVGQVISNAENASIGDGLNSTEEVVEAVSETKSSSTTKKLGAVRGDALKNGKDQKGPTVVADKKKPNLSQSLSFQSRGVMAKANGLKKSMDGKPTKPDSEVKGTDSKPSVYARLSHPIRRVSTGESSIEAKPSVEGVTSRRATLASVPNMRRSVSKKYGSVKTSINGPTSEVSQSQDQSSNRLSLPTKDDEDARSATSSTTPRGSRRNSGSGFAFRLDERAEKRKEFYSKIEEKIHAKEVERNNLQAKSKESQEEAIKQLRKNLTFKAMPMPTFYKEPPPPKTELKKIPSTRPISPKLGRHKTHIAAAEDSTEGPGSCQNPISSSSANPSKPTGKGAQANSNGDSVSLKKTFRKSLSKFPSQKSATIKTEAKVPSSKPKTRDPELETQKANDGETEIPSISVENASQETESIEFKTDEDHVQNAKISLDTSALANHSNEVDICN